MRHAVYILIFLGWPGFELGELIAGVTLPEWTVAVGASLTVVLALAYITQAKSAERYRSLFQESITPKDRPPTITYRGPERNN